MSKITLYLGRDGWRWTLRARNGRIIGASTEAYQRRGDAFRNMQRVTNLHYLDMDINPRDSSWLSLSWRVDR